MVQASRGHAHEGRHRAFYAVPESEPFRIEIVKSLADECRIAGKHGRRFADYAVAFLKAPHAIAAFRDDSEEFMSQHDGKIYRPALRACILMKVAAANAHRLHGKKDIVFADLGNWQL